MGSMSKWRKERDSARTPKTSEAGTSNPDAMKMAIESVGPEQALRWLAANPSNRPISEELVKRYALDMRNGRWKTTHQGIAFDRAGLLLDGQHRLKAIIRAGATIRLAVIRDCERDTFDRLDTGKKRSVADALAVDGTDNARTVAAIARSLIVFGFRESSVSDSFIVEFARERSHELAEYVQLVPALTASGAAAFAFAAVDPDLGPTVRRLMADMGGREIEDLRRCIKAMSSGIGAASQRARYTLAMNTIAQLAGRGRR